jgi:hypothetical protein
MSVYKKMFTLAVVCLANFSAAQLSDQIAAARVLGPHWRELSRSAGMIFSGTLLGIDAQPAGMGRPLPLVLTQFRVDRAIAGVRAGEVLAIREWAGAWSMSRPMGRGQRFLIFLYPTSRLGLTSPVGGRLGQVVLDSGGEIVRSGVPAPNPRFRLPPTGPTNQVDVASGTKARFRSSHNAALKRCFAQRRTPFADCVVTQPIVTLTQLERAIRNARNNNRALTIKE